VKIGKNSTVKLRHSKAKKVIKKLNNKVHSKRPVKNLKVLENSLKAKWLKEIEEDEFEESKISGLLKWQIKSKKYYVKDKYTILPKAYWK